MSGDLLTSRFTHTAPSCQKPTASRRRWRGSIWVCSDCGRAWVSLCRAGMDAPHAGLDFGSDPFWSWWSFPLRHSSAPSVDAKQVAAGERQEHTEEKI